MDDTTWQLVETERLGIAELLGSLTVDQWSITSMCSQWRIKDVAAHLAMTPSGAPSVGTLLRALIANRGHLWSAGRDVAIDYAGRPTEDLVADLRRDAGSRRKPVFVVADNILLDLVVHGQDIARPLGVDRPIPAAAGEQSLRRIWAMGWPFHARRRFVGHTVRAEDCDWSAGSGPEVHAPTAELLLLMTARRIDVSNLPGLGPARARFATFA